MATSAVTSAVRPARTSAASASVTPSRRYLVKNNKSGVFYYRKAVPQDLLGHYKKREIKVSLKTSHRPAALLLYGSVSAKVEMELAMVRAGHSLGHSQPSQIHSQRQPAHQHQDQRERQQEPQQVTLSSLLKTFLSEKQGGWTAKTGDEYRATFGLFEKYFSGSKPVSAINRQDCVQFRDKLVAGWSSKRKSRTPKTVNKMLTLLGSVFRYGIQSDLLYKNPCEGINLKMTKSAREERSAFSSDQLTTLFSKLPAEGHERDIPLVALYSGLRIEEVCQLRKENIREEDGVQYIDVTGSHLKTLSSRRRVAIHPALESLLERLSGASTSNDSFLFSSLKTDRYGCRSTMYSKDFGRWLRKTAGIEDRSICFHSFRHTFAKELKQNDVEHSVISELLGHSSKGTTARYAKGYSLRQLKVAVDTLDMFR